VLVAIACSLIVMVDEFRRPQKMWIMNVVWPLTTLFGSAAWLFAYYRWGRSAAHDGHAQQAPFPVQVAKGTNHCGAGCALGDLTAEWLGVIWPGLALWLGWRSLFAEKTFAIWIADFILAFLFGVVFQYFTIKPMRNLSPAQGLLAALKADAASISAWQVGMYGLMAVIQFGWYRHSFGAVARVATPEFWFAMQLAMLAGFLTSYPINGLLLRKGWKEAM
jgi:hypothetical protein